MQCTNVLIDYFFKEFVYKNLYVYDGKQKKELCDGLVEFQDAYVIFKLKKRMEVRLKTGYIRKYIEKR